MLNAQVSSQVEFFPQTENNTGRCLTCHGMRGFAYKDSLQKVVNLYVDSTQFFNSAHSKLRCQDCHQDITQYPHVSAVGAKLSCDAECHAAKEGRTYTHKEVYSTFLHSVHGKSLTGEDADAPTCLYCHQGSAHNVLPVKKVMTADEKMSLCATCHNDRELMIKHHVNPDAVSSYKQSFHWKAVEYGFDRAAVCEDCHTSHDVLPPGNPRSTVYIKNLPQTCGKSGCHPGAKMNFASSGANHLSWTVGKYKGLTYELWFYYVVIGGTVSALLIGVILDVQRRIGFPKIAHNLGVEISKSMNGLAKLGVKAWKLVIYILIK
ncbi:MAG: hypothetical protein ACP5MI_07415 [Candidatus Kryptoniota bacterium]